MRTKHWFAVAGVFLCSLTTDAFGQIKGAEPQPSNTNVKFVTIHFETEVLKVNGVNLPAPAPAPAVSSELPPPSIYVFDQNGNRVYLTSKVRPAKDIGGDDPFGLELFDFKTVLGTQAFDLIRGGIVNGVTITPKVEDDQSTYYITWEKIELKGKSRPVDIFTTVSVGTLATNAPSLIATRESDNEIGLDPTGIDKPGLLNALKANPQAVGIAYSFGRNDPATNFEEQAKGVGDKPTAPGAIIVNLGRDLPARPEEYKVTLTLPAELVRPLLKKGFAIPVEEETVPAVLTVSEPPPSTERSKTEFYFENTFTSIVNANNQERSNVGLFGVHLKPLVGLRFFNTDVPDRRGWWMAFRPLFDADVDTQPIKDSQAPNRIVFGMDFELGLNAKRQQKTPSLLAQVIWLNGLRYDSDRDFKLQTLYWHTEFGPRLRNFEQTREQRLFQFRHPCSQQPDNQTCRAIAKGRARLFPFVSSYYVRPSFGYQIGSIVKRDARMNPFPTDTISRLFVKFGAGIELKRLVQFSVDDSYYFLENATSYRNRNYLVVPEKI